MTVLGAIGGAGWLGAALLRAALRKGILAASSVWISSRSGQFAGFEPWRGIHATQDNAALAAASDIILLTVRPQDIGTLDLDLSGKLVFSVMAMVDMEMLHQRFGATRIVRAMPNAAAEQCLSFTPLLFSEACTGEDRALATAFFEASGEVAEVRSEDELAYFTGLTGSGPAFLAAFADAMITDATKQGVSPDIADRAVRQLLRGGVGLLVDAPTSPASMVETFMDYRGTTAAGLKAMEDSGLKAVVASGLAAARKRALGQA